MNVLTPSQVDTLHAWIASGYPYPTLATMMQNHFGVVLSASGVTWHRQHYATKIASIQAETQRQEERRKRDREGKAARRAGSTPARHCATCQCGA